MVTVMRVDVVPTKHLIVLAASAVLCLVVAIIIGATGPPVYDSTQYFAYDCPHNSHEWDPFSCNGVQLSDNTTFWETQAPVVNTLNRFWSLHFTPYTLQDTSVGPVQRLLNVHVELYGKDDADESAIWSLLSNETRGEMIICPQDSVVCNTILLVYEESLDYGYYYVRVNVLNGGMYDSDLEPFIGDVQFEFRRAHDGFSSLELGLHTTFMFVSCGVLAAVLWGLKRFPTDEWSWEQRALVLLLFGILALNNPFFGLQYVARGWFFHFLDALFYVAFLADFLMFALLVLDKTRLEEMRVEFGFHHAPKIAAVGVFGVLGVVLFSWVNIRDRVNPILGWSGSVTGIQVLFYCDATVFVGILIWLGVLIVLTIPVATNKPYLLTRFLFVSVPTGVVVLSILIGIFAGTFGSFNSNSLSTTYFLTMYNVYIWVLTYGYWPVEQRFSVRNPTEGDRLTFGKL